MGPQEIAVIAFGALAGGFVSGLAGFGTGLTALGIWLHVVSAPVAASLVVVCSVAAHMLSLPLIWGSTRPARVLPFIVPGLLAVPLGAACLAYLDPRALKGAMGIILLVFCLYMLLVRRPHRIAFGGRLADAAVGFGGGWLGGLAGLSGVLPTVWATLRGWPKDESRSVFQAFNASILGLALITHAAQGLLTQEVGWAVLAALPGTLAGAWAGTRAYGRLDDELFRAVVLVLLLASGAFLAWSNL